MKGSDILSSEMSIVSAAKPFQKPANKEYLVSKLKKPMKIDGNWNKAQWKKIETIKIDNYILYKNYKTVLN